MRKLFVLITCVAVGAWALPAVAQYSQDNDGLSASADGVELNGQDDYYNPVPSTSVSAKVYTYAANALGLPTNPTGGSNFVAGEGPAGGFFSRSQRDVTYGGGTGSWTISYDMAAAFVGQAPAADNIGSFSTQVFTPGTEATYIHLASWVDVNNPVAWNSTYIGFDAAGTQFPPPYANPGAAWEALELNHWYRSSTTFDLDTNQITEVCIEDLADGGSPHNGCFSPTDWYLDGGAAGLPPPSGFRYFAGSSTVAGNVLAFDNLEITPEPASAFLLAAGGLMCLRRRR